MIFDVDVDKIKTKHNRIEMSSTQIFEGLKISTKNILTLKMSYRYTACLIWRFIYLEVFPLLLGMHQKQHSADTLILKKISICRMAKLEKGKYEFNFVIT